MSRISTFLRGPRPLPPAGGPAGNEGGPPLWLAEGSYPPLSDVPVLTSAELTRLVALGINPMELAGRLRLVLPVGCARDFTQTRAILRTSAARDQLEAAIQALIDRGAHCDCAVFRAVGEPPRCALWHPL